MTTHTGETNAIEKIRHIKKTQGDQLCILTHHYQRKEIVALGDHCGDSLGLSRIAAQDRNARYIVFCGVHFMAESAAILARPEQTVQIPKLSAGCWMADMIDDTSVGRAWREITSVTGDNAVTPIVYVNSDADIKAFCGRNDGLTCTSSNAHKAFSYAFARKEKILFLPDEHLGRNTAHKMGIVDDEIVVWDPDKPLGGNTEDAIRSAKVILWNGYCLVHTRFQPEHIEGMKRRFPNALVVVHPECTAEVVAMADAVGSTSFIVDYVEKAPAGSTILIGTEINLIDRLADAHPDKQIYELHRSLCPNMFKINVSNLLDTLEHLGEKNVVSVPEAVKADARVALQRMLDLP